MLPIPGDADNRWSLLNDLLEGTHRADGTLRGIAQVVNVGDYGTDTDAIRAALDQRVEPGPSVVYFPPGQYRISEPAQIPSSTWVVGAGAETVLQRRGPAKAMLDVAGGDQIRISNVTFDADTTDNFRHVVFADNTNGLTIDHCRFFNSKDEAADPESTLLAVLARTTTGFRFTHNHVDGLQVKAGGAGDSRRITVSHNTFLRSKQYALSTVGTYDRSSLTDVTIANNTMVDWRSGALYIGAESGRDVRCERISVFGNTIVAGENIDPNNGRGIWCRIAAVSRDWTITGNQIIDPRLERTQHAGIVLRRSSPEGDQGHLEGLTITGNAIRGWRGQAIQVAGNVDGFIIANNTVDDTTGIALLAVEGPLARGTAHGNVGRLRRDGHGVDVRAHRFGVDMVRVAGNVLTDGENGVRLDAGSSAIRLDCVGNTLTGHERFGIFEADHPDVTGRYATRYFDNDCRGNGRRGVKTTSAAQQRDNAT